MSERGVFAMDRGWFGHPAFAPEPYTEREAWAWLIAEAAWRPVRVRVGSEIVVLKRGQLSHSLRFMAERWQWDKEKVRRYLRRLEKRDMIETASETGQTVISICNYNAYQRVSLPDRDSCSSKSEPAPRQHRDKEEDIKGIEEERVVSAQAPAPSSSISPEAFALSNDFLTAIGVDPTAPELQGMSGAPYTAQMWLTRGYERALILATAADIAARQRPDIPPLTYFTKALERAHSRRPAPEQKPLPLPLQPIEGGANGTNRQGTNVSNGQSRGENLAARGLRKALALQAITGRP